MSNKPKVGDCFLRKMGTCDVACTVLTVNDDDTYKVMIVMLDKDGSASIDIENSIKFDESITRKPASTEKFNDLLAKADAVITAAREAKCQ